MSNKKTKWDEKKPSYIQMLRMMSHHPVIKEPKVVLKPSDSNDAEIQLERIAKKPKNSPRPKRK